MDGKAIRCVNQFSYGFSFLSNLQKMKGIKTYFQKTTQSLTFETFSIPVFLFAIFFMSFCHTPKERIELEHPMNLVCQRIELDNELFIPLKINFIDGRFFIPDFHGEKMIHEINLGSFDWVKNFGLRGQGPVEFIGPLLTWEFDKKLFVFDRRGFKLGFYEVNIPDPLSVYKYRDLFGLDQSISKLISINQNYYLAAGYFPNGRYAILDSLGKISGYFGTYPTFMDGEDKVPFDAKAMFHQVKFTANYEKNKTAALSQHVLDIIDFSGPKPVIFSRTKLANYAYEYQAGVMVRANLELGFVKGGLSITSSQNSIFVLFDPNIEGNTTKNGKANREILVFDWDGKLNTRHKILCDLSLIKIVDEKFLYGITENLDFVFIDH